jgi:hypothetical protein
MGRKEQASAQFQITSRLTKAANDSVLHQIDTTREKNKPADQAGGTTHDP